MNGRANCRQRKEEQRGAEEKKWVRRKTDK
jgi:hypothetical protein